MGAASTKKLVLATTTAIPTTEVKAVIFMVETVLDSQLCDIFASDAEAVVGDSLLTTLGMRNRKARCRSPFEQLC